MQTVKGKFCLGLLAHLAQPVTLKRVALAKHQHQYLQMRYASKLGR
jgi:hypothetical protein